MNFLTSAEEFTKPIELAREAPFDLGRAHVTPELREVAVGDTRLNLEPRAMQVLVTLAGAGGRTVSRDELTARCWDGRIVGENALNQVILRLRRLAAEIGPGGFELRTVKKVGYRLVASAAAADFQPAGPVAGGVAPAAPSDRRLLMAAAAAAIATAGVFGWSRLRKDAPAAAAREAYERGLEAQRFGERDEARQAIADFQQATRIAPDFVEAWGALALGYRLMLESTDGREQLAMESRAQDAARRALALDPRNADATAAVRLLRPNFGRWGEVEAECRRLRARFPNHWFIESALAAVLADVGRWTDAIPILERLIARDRLRPAAHTHLAVALWAVGRYDDAERRLDAALSIYPSHAALWITKFNVLALTGKPEAALALAHDGSRPAAITVMPLDLGIACARALGAGAGAGAGRDRDAAAAGIVQAVKQGVMWAGIATLYLCALDRVDQAFGVLRPYLFGSPDGPPLLDAHARLSTAFLFNSPATPLRADPRFAEYTAGLGLETYWRSTGSLPDYRRVRA